MKKKRDSKRDKSVRQEEVSKLRMDEWMEFCSSVDVLIQEFPKEQFSAQLIRNFKFFTQIIFLQILKFNNHEFIYKKIFNYLWKDLIIYQRY